MDQWKAVWQIIDERLHCRTCGAWQDVTEARHPFEHQEGCTAAISAEQMPWRDLAASLRTELVRSAD